MILRSYTLFTALNVLLIFTWTLSFAEEPAQSLNEASFDKYFTQYTKKYFGPHFDWRYFKAQAIAESGLSPQACSPNGALGLMQILPSTFQEIVRKNMHIQGRITDPRSNIAAGIYYNRMLWEEWHADRSFKDKIAFMFASYNAGKYTILKAQKIAIEKGLDPCLWPSIAEALPDVNGDRSRETVAYVDRIHKIRSKLHREALSQVASVTSYRGGHSQHRIPLYDRLRSKPLLSKLNPPGDFDHRTRSAGSFFPRVGRRADVGWMAVLMSSQKGTFSRQAAKGEK